MDKFKIVTPCHFGVESVLKREITDLDMILFKLKTEELLSREMHWQFVGQMFFLERQKE